MAKKMLASTVTDSVFNKLVQDPNIPVERADAPFVKPAIEKAVNEEVIPRIEHLTSTEEWYQRRSFWSAAVSLVIVVVTPLLTKYGFTVDPDTQDYIVTVCTTGGGLIAGWLAIRAGTASKPLGA